MNEKASGRSIDVNGARGSTARSTVTALATV
jgi:hypothetical protein